MTVQRARSLSRKAMAASWLAAFCPGSGLLGLNYSIRVLKPGQRGWGTKVLSSKEEHKQLSVSKRCSLLWHCVSPLLIVMSLVRHCFSQTWSLHCIKHIIKLQLWIWVWWWLDTGLMQGGRVMWFLVLLWSAVIGTKMISLFIPLSALHKPLSLWVCVEPIEPRHVLTCCRELAHRLACHQLLYDSRLKDVKSKCRMGFLPSLIHATQAWLFDVRSSCVHRWHTCPSARL